MTASRCLPRRAATPLLLGVWLFTSPAFAVVAPSTPSFDVDRLAHPADISSAPRAATREPLQQSAAWTEWSQRYPGWRASWNERTGTLHRSYGPGLRIAGGLANADQVESACRTFLSEAAALTGVAPQELHLLAADHRLGRWYVVFDQVVDGLPVRGSRADVRVSDRGDVLLFGADWHRNARTPRTAAIAADAALRAAGAGLGDSATETTHELVIVPEAEGDGFKYHLAYELRFKTAEPRGVWLALVDATNGELLKRENQIRYATLTGQITSQIEPVTVNDPLQSVPLRDTRFNVGTGATEFGFTDVDGLYNVTTASTDSVNVRIRLSGRWGRVFNQQLALATPTIDARMLPGSPRDFEWNASNSRASERDAYYQAFVAHTNIKALDPSLTGLDYQMPITVDIFDRDCNAFYDGFGINFFGESGRCVNTARIADVVLHEYGHGITDRVYRPLAPSGAMHEGFSDYWAATLMNDPRIGIGFRGPGTIIRTVDNTNRFPDDVVGEVHRDGLIIAGALWDLREAVGKGAADSLFHYARYGRADNFDDYLLDVLATDDDNGNIYDGTPHFDPIIAAFSAHGIGDYSVQITHAPAADTEDLVKPLTLESVILSIFQLEPMSLQLHYRVDGGAWTVLPLAATGAAVREFAATIPSQTAGSTADYYMTAADNQGHTATLPLAGETAPFTFRIGTDTTPPSIVHEPLGDQPIDAPQGWPVVAEVTDNLDHGVASVIAEWGVNSTTLAQNVALTPRLPRWGGPIASAGTVLGDVIHYRVVAVDSATSPNTAFVPGVNDYSFRVVQGFARDFEADDAGFTATNDWAWGTPVGDPTPFDGVKVWGTGIGGSYSDDTVSDLETLPIDLGTWNAAALVFWQWLDSEPGFDGGRVDITADGGMTWNTIVPSGGYPVDFVGALGGPGYNGNSGGWHRAAFDLSQFLGQTVALRWHFASDAGIVDRGWFIDDVKVVERQVLSVPLAAHARNGLDAQVPLRWSAPAGIDPLAISTPLQGYHVYRGTLPDLSDAVQITGAPLTEARFTDATAVNGQLYFYGVTALYAAGESEPSDPAPGMAYVSGYSADAASLDVSALETAADTVVTFTNTGTGFLNLNVWLGDPTDTTLDQVRVRWPLAAAGSPAKAGRDAMRSAWRDAPRFDLDTTLQTLAAGRKTKLAPPAAAKATPVTSPDGGYQLLYTDTSEMPAPVPDLHELWAQEVGAELRFKITAYQAWVNPLADFNMLLGVDADGIRASGDASGNDFYVLIGPFPLAQFGVPAVIVAGQSVIGVPTFQVLPSNASEMEIGFPRAFVGDSEAIGLMVIVRNPSMQTTRDLLPDTRATAAWLRPQALSVSAPQGSPAQLAMLFPGTVPFGHYAGKVFLETNAPGNPFVTIPVAYHYASTPVAITDLAASQVDGDVEVRWRTTLEQDVAAFRVFRGRGNGAFEVSGPDVTPQPGRSYVFRDRAPEPGTYTYRIAEVATNGTVTVAGTTSITVTQNAPAVTFLDAAVPNPFNPTTTLRFGVAVDGPAELVIFDARGRQIRALWRTPHAAAGYQRVTWNGLDDAGHTVASGVYHARLLASGRTITRRLTLLK